MTPRQLLLKATKQFIDAGVPDPETDSALLLSYLCHRHPLSLRLDAETVLDPVIINRFNELAERRSAREPLQYITNQAYFFGRMFYVDSRVLIPRPETELLCSLALALPFTGEESILDLCCGSGCIVLTIKAQRPSHPVTLSDISADALSVANLNAEALHLNVTLHQGDLTEGLPEESFHLVVSNPPYIPTAECPHLQKEVCSEPSIALDGGADGMDFYRRIIPGAWHVLDNNGFLLMELGINESSRVRAMLENGGFSGIEIKKDLNGIDRIILARKVSGRAHV